MPMETPAPPGIKISHFDLTWDPELRAMNEWRLECCACSFFVTNPYYHMGVSPGHLESRFDILSYFIWDPQGARTMGKLRLCTVRRTLINFLTNPYNMGVYWLMEFQWLRFWQRFEMTWVPQDIGHMVLCCFISEKVWCKLLGIYSHLFFNWICVSVASRCLV